MKITNVLLWKIHWKRKNSHKMSAKGKDAIKVHSDLCNLLWRDIVSPSSCVVKLASAFDWQSFEGGLSAKLFADNGRLSLVWFVWWVCRMISMHQRHKRRSRFDGWIENLYWRYCATGIYFEHEYPTAQSTILHRPKNLLKRCKKMLEKSLKNGTEWRFHQKIETELCEYWQPRTEKAIHDQMSCLRLIAWTSGKIHTQKRY